MRAHFTHDIKALGGMLADLAALVQHNAERSLRALLEADAVLAVQVMRDDQSVNSLEVRIEAECLRLTALFQPVADDLRYLVVALKVNRELERISDLAVDIAREVHRLPPGPSTAWRRSLAGLTARVLDMVQGSAEALVQRDDALAARIWAMDREIDRGCLQGQREVEALLETETDGSVVRGLVSMLAVLWQLERLADHAKNIAKNVIYLVQGEIARHRAADFRPRVVNKAIRALFVDADGRVDSPLAAALTNHLAGDRLEAVSAAVMPGTIAAGVKDVLREAGIAAALRPAEDVYHVLKLEGPFRYLVSLGDSAAARCPPPPRGTQEVHWNLPGESAPGDGGDLARLRARREALQQQLDAWLASLPDAAETPTPTAAQANERPD
ncbi:MAG: phosphate signaling complex protein PhoU [Lentisphaerae bacterium]|nr:phosphate signaling complex protein PhoU [Lentisphaerota bacterium]